MTDGLIRKVVDLRLACTRIGHPLAQKVHHHDLWIAAAALHLGAVLFSTDGVFDGVPDLRRPGGSA